MEDSVNVYALLVHIHSILRWLVLAAIILSLFIAYQGKKRREYNAGIGYHRFALIMVHLQFIAGIVLYFISPKVIMAATSFKDPVLRFFFVEHLIIMLAAVVVITIGFVKYKKTSDYRKKLKRIIVYYTIGLIIILIGIPWPFRNLGAGWL